jgi:hypothetical protein
MQSPFPGMDPFIEAGRSWKDFHDRLIASMSNEISDALPEGYIARVGERSYIALVESEEKTDHHFEPDVKVTGPRAKTPGRGRDGGRAAADLDGEVVTLRAFIEEDFEESFIDIYELDPERRLVTSIEVLSPSNKVPSGPGRKRYLRKRQSLLMGKANLVEIDLLRGGTRMPMLDPLPDSPYYILVSREEKAPFCRVWPAYFDRPLPPIPIPLSRPDPDIRLELQPLVDAIYQRSRYYEDIDYSALLTPPLSALQLAWIGEELKRTSKPKRPRTSHKRRR